MAKKKKRKKTLPMIDDFGNRLDQITDKNGNTYNRIRKTHSAEDIRTKPGFAGTRKINKQFGAGSIIAKAIHNPNWTLWYNHFKDYKAHGRLSGKISKFIDTNEGIHGQRPAIISKNKAFLEAFPLDEEKKLNAFLNPYNVVPSINDNRSKVSVKVEIFDGMAGPLTYHYPFVQLIMVVVVLSDYVFNTATNEYEPVNPDENALAAYAVSEVKETPENQEAILLEVTIPLAQPPKDTTNLLVFLGVQHDNKPAPHFNGSVSARAMELIKIY